MALENLDYVAILADMKAKRAALDASIYALEAAMASGTLGQFGTGTAPTSGFSGNNSSSPVELPVGAFLGKSVPAAIKLYLSATKRKQTNLEITTALKEGGVESTGDIDKVIRNGLWRLKESGEVLRFKDGWGLAEHYNESFRARLSQNQKPATKPKKKAKKKSSPKKPKAASKVEEPKTAEAKPEQAAVKKGGEQAAIENFFADNPGQDFASRDLAQILGIRVQTIALINSKLAHQGKLERVGENKFRLAKVHTMPKAV